MPNMAPVPGASASITGTVVDLPEGGTAPGKPLSILLPGDHKVSVNTNARTRVARRVTVEVKDLDQGDQFVAAGTVDQNGVTQAVFALTGDVNNLIAGGIGRGLGMFGGFLGPGAGAPGPPPPPQ